jgi:hypothetical protein
MVSGVFLVALISIGATGPTEQERFKAYFTQGEALYERGEFGAAIWNFRQADQLRVTPEVAFDLAKCHEKLGDRAFSTYYYRLYLHRSPKANDALEVAERIGAALAQAESEGRGLLEVESEVPGKATVNGQTFAEFPIALFLPPGDYEIAAQFPSGSRKLLGQIKTGKTTKVVFDAPAPPLLLANEDKAYAPKAELAAQAGPSRREIMRVGSLAMFGASALALVGGTAFGLMSQGDANRYQTERSSLHVREASELVASANARASAANMLWAAGLAGAAAGGVLFVLSMPEPGLKSGGTQ